MSDLAKKILEIGGYLFGVLVLAFTGYQTWSLLFEASENAITASIGLVLFEGGMVYWWATFQKSAEGIGQMAVSFLMAVFGLLLVFGATTLHLGAVSDTVLGENTTARLIAVAAAINLLGKFTFPLMAPDTFNDIWRRALEGRIALAAFREAESKVDDLSIELAHVIGQELVRRLQVTMLTEFGISHELAKGLPVAVAETAVVDSKAETVDSNVEADGIEMEIVSEPKVTKLSENGHEIPDPNG